ncbi:MAG TPA: phosphotransferase [Acidimicrobiales bacterium]|nr:phosphotransferase [Acidimicrobiales bacterium]
MTEDEVRVALARVGLGPARVKELQGGWSNSTFDLDGSHIVRFPRTDAVALATHRELSLLPELGARVSFAIPTPSHAGVWRGRPFFAYPRLPGRPLEELDQAVIGLPALATMLAELHRFPVDRAAELLQLGAPDKVWRHRYEDLWPTFSDVALPELDTHLADDVRRSYEAFVEHPPQFPITLIHNDLGAEHVLVDETSGAPTGIIDFEDATVGDPAIDLTPLVAALGPGALPTLSGDRDLGERVTDRMHFYRWVGSLHCIVYGVTEGVDEERRGGIDALRRRLAPTP